MVRTLYMLQNRPSKMNQSIPPRHTKTKSFFYDRNVDFKICSQFNEDMVSLWSNILFNGLPFPIWKIPLIYNETSLKLRRAISSIHFTLLLLNADMKIIQNVTVFDEDAFWIWTNVVNWRISVFACSMQVISTFPAARLSGKITNSASIVLVNFKGKCSNDDVPIIKKIYKMNLECIANVR